jgi:hypothetical protein
MGDRTTPVRALHAVQAHLAREEGQFRASLPGVALSQGEYDVYVDFLYQYGIGNWRASSMRRHLLQGEYRQACDALLLWKRAGGYDCSTRIDGRPNTVCWGVGSASSSAMRVAWRSSDPCPHVVVMASLLLWSLMSWWLALAR